MAATEVSPALEMDKERPGSADSWQSWQTYNFEWLFDPERFDHLPIEEQLKLYKHRDLKHTKIYKIAARIWGAPLSRKRKIVAPPMNTTWEQGPLSTGIKAQQINSELKPTKAIRKQQTSADHEEMSNKNNIKSYNKWMNDRKKFRANLDNMGLNEEWLARKPDKTALEHRVLRRMIEERNPKAPPPPVC